MKKINSSIALALGVIVPLSALSSFDVLAKGGKPDFAGGQNQEKPFYGNGAGKNMSQQKQYKFQKQHQYQKQQKKNHAGVNADLEKGDRIMQQDQVKLQQQDQIKNNLSE